MHDFYGTTSSPDIVGRKANFLTSIDARVKTACVLAALALNLLSTSMWAPVCIAILCLAALLLIKIPAKLLLLRLSMPLAMACVVLITQTFMYGATPILSIGSGYFQLTAYKEGLDRGLLIMLRVIAGMSLILFLSISTPAHKLLGAARWLRMPAELVELTLLIYRYIFVLIEETLIMQEAQKVRLGYCSWRLSMNSLSILGACVIIRAYDRAERVYEAMLVRGYTQGKTSPNEYRLYAVDWAAILICVTLLAGLFVIGQFV